MNDDGETSSSIDRLNRFIEAGWMTLLAPTELRAWLCYHKHADASGVSFPGADRVAAFIGHNKAAHVFKVRKRLIALGLLAKVGFGRYRVTFTPPPADSKIEKFKKQLAKKNSKLESKARPSGDGKQFQSGTTCDAIDSKVELPTPETIPVRNHFSSKLESNLLPVRNAEQTNEQTNEVKDIPAAPVVVTKVKSEPKQKPESVPVPDELNTPEFCATWNKFLKHRQQAGKKLTATAAETQLAKLRGWGVERALIAVEHSTAQGWQGIYEPNKSSGSSNDRRASTAAAREFTQDDRPFPVHRAGSGRANAQDGGQAGG